MDEKEVYEYNVGNMEGFQHSYNTGMDNTPLTVGEWVITILILMIPIAGIVLYFVWAFGKSGNINRRNYCRAYLIISAIGLAVSIALCIIIAAMLGVFINL